MVHQIGQTRRGRTKGAFLSDMADRFRISVAAVSRIVNRAGLYANRGADALSVGESQNGKQKRERRLLFLLSPAFKNPIYGFQTSADCARSPPAYPSAIAAVP
jgi:hypothetical protein